MEKKPHSNQASWLGKAFTYVVGTTLALWPVHYFIGGVRVFHFFYLAVFVGGLFVIAKDHLWRRLLNPTFWPFFLSDIKKHAWFMDQYKNPHESKHTIGEVLKWFEQSGIEFINSASKPIAFEPLSVEEKLFKSNPKGKKIDRSFVHLGMLLGGGKEGGFFIMIGRKKV